MSEINFIRREIYGYWFKGNKTPLVGETITFETTEDLGYTAENFIAKRKITAVVGEDGKFTAWLWCDETSDVAIDWAVQFPADPMGQTADEKELPEPRVFSIVYGDGSAIALGSLLLLSIPEPDDVTLLYQSVNGYIQTLVDNGTIGGQIDQTINDGSVNAVAGNAVFDALAAKQTAIDTKIRSALGSPSTVKAIWSGTQAQYDALTPDDETIYLIS